MKRRRKHGWSFLVMRGADQSVRQFHVSKRSVVAAPAAAVLAVTGIVTALQLRSNFLIQELEQKLEEQAAAHTVTVQAKEDAVVSLEQELERISRQTSELQERLHELHELENKLKHFIEAYGDIVEPSVSAVPPAANERELVLLAKEGGLSFRQISVMVDAMEDSMAQSVRLAKAREAELRTKPSEWPTMSVRLTSGFGYRKDPFTGRTAFHAGVDIAGKTGDPVFAAADGTVLDTGYDKNKGYYVVIGHRNELKTVYMHLKSFEVREKDTVVQGEKIGLLGSTGRSTGPHLHFEIMQSNEPVNPLKYLNR
ncbi:M23 family metallopeptidase [Paenibacillus tarimensis]